MARKESKYAWFVVFCSFMLHFITDGVSYTFGIFFSALLTEYQSSNAVQAWVPSIMTGITYGIGPVASILTNKYGCSIIAISGTTLSSLGYLLSTFSPNVTILYLTLGVLAGSGFGLIYLPAIVCITQYFSVHLALATGLAVSASGIGSAIFAPLTEYFVQKFGWKISMQLTSLLLLSSGLFALSFKEFREHDNSTQKISYLDSENKVSKSNIKKLNQKKFNFQNDKNSKNLNKKDILNNENVLIRKKNHLSEVSLTSISSNDHHSHIINTHLNNLLNDNTGKQTVIFEDKQKLDNKINNINHEKKINTLDKELLKSNNFDSKLHQQQHLKNTINLQLPSLIENSNSNFEESNFLDKNLINTNLYKSHTNLDLNKSQVYLMPLNSQSKSQHNLHYNHNLCNNSISNLNTIVLYSTSMTSIYYCTSQDTNSELTVMHSSNCPNIKHNSLPNQQLTNVLKTLLPTKTSNDTYFSKLQYKLFIRPKKSPTQINSLFKKKKLPTITKLTNFHNYIKTLLSWNLLKDKLFLWFVISNFLTSLGYYVPHIYIKQRCLVIPESTASECSYLFSIMGVSSTIGRILFGFLSDFKNFNRIFIYSNCLTLCGLANIMTVFATNYFYLSIYCIVFGLTTGAFVSLTSVILVDLLGLDRLSNAFGLLLLFQGVASLTGPPIIGWLYDLTLSYDPGFCFIAFATILSGMMLYFVPYLQKSFVINLN